MRGPANDEGPTVPAVGPSFDSTPGKGIDIVEKSNTGVREAPFESAAALLMNAHEMVVGLVTIGKTIASMSDGAQALLGLIERLGNTRDATIAERIWLQCNWLAIAAVVVQTELQAEMGS